MNKIKIVQGPVEAVGFGGSGIIKSLGKAIFVPFSVPGDVVEVEIQKEKKNYATGSILRILKPSPFRIIPRCPYFTHCGGCQFQHLPIEKQEEYKKQFLLDALLRIGKWGKQPTDEGGEKLELEWRGAKKIWGYRNQILLRLQSLPKEVCQKEVCQDGICEEKIGRTTLEVGYVRTFLAEKKSHDPVAEGCSSADSSARLLPIQECIIFHELGDEILLQLKKFINNIPLSPHLLTRSGKNSFPEGRVRLVKASGGYLIAISFLEPLPTEFLKAFEKTAPLALKEFPNWRGIILKDGSHNSERCWGLSEWEEQILGTLFRFSPFCFSQNHKEQAEILYQTVLDCIPMEETRTETKTETRVVDLFCGTGILSLLLALQKKAKTLGIEWNSQAIRLAKQNLQNITPNLDRPVLFWEGDCDLLAKKGIETLNPHYIIVNPPRTGLSPPLCHLLNELGSSIDNTTLQGIIYISCMPSTLARDLAILQKNYCITRCVGIDHFPQTTHLETVVKLERRPRDEGKRKGPSL